MSRTTITSSIKGTSTLVRARFTPGMLLHHDDLEQINAYTRELSRLMFRSLFGCGVVCGLVVDKPRLDCGKLVVTVSSGLAIDCSGDPVYVPKDQTLALDEECEGEIPSPLYVLLCGITKCCSPRTSVCASDEDEASSVCTRERDGFEIRIVREPLPKCICACLQPPAGAGVAREGEEGRFIAPDHENECACVSPEHPCYRDHYDGKCGCAGGQECNCCCECILLARLDVSVDKPADWNVDHGVRRFLRPVLAVDPEVKRQRAKALLKQEQLRSEKEKEIEKEKVEKEKVEKEKVEREKVEKEKVEKEKVEREKEKEQEQKPLATAKARAKTNRFLKTQKTPKL